MYVYFFLSDIEDNQDTKLFTAHYPGLYLNCLLETIIYPSGQFETPFVSNYLSQGDMNRTGRC